MVVRERKRSRSLTNENHIYDVIRMNQPDKPIHQYRDSLFSLSSGFVNFRGFFTLALILLVLATLRVALENLIKYGILINYSKIFAILLSKETLWPTIISIILFHIFALISFKIECLLSENRLSEKRAFYLIVLNLVSILVWPILLASYVKINVIFSSLFSLYYLIGFFKIYSYHNVNYWCRLSRRKTHKRYRSGDWPQDYLERSQQQLIDHNQSYIQTKKASSKQQQCTNHFNNQSHLQQSSTTKIEQITTENKKQTKPSSASLASPTASASANNRLNNIIFYPDNLTLADLFYFIYVPTLCYELNFPRTDRIRKRFLLQRLFEVIFLTQLNIALIQQWMVPTIHNSLRPLQEMDYFRMLERLLKLSIPNHVIWLIWFYLFFHSYLNLIGEILRFGDREFYRDWWNARTLSYFWRNWNIPVHRWCVRHMFIPLLNRGYSKTVVTTCVFLFSALFHEYLVAVPMRMFSGWAFVGMALQIPFMFLLSNEWQYANIFVWFSLIIGQPLCILACYHDYYILHHLKN
ncbi:hypothetical protein NH340_JMT06563 [Sarcoptes scabiei]|nr:hypothetical protein NH340_JMT06563 [Sarcoptes scabiei]